MGRVIGNAVRGAGSPFTRRMPCRNISKSLESKYVVSMHKSEIAARSDPIQESTVLA
jgi:hypothetical protein